MRTGQGRIRSSAALITDENYHLKLLNACEMVELDRALMLIERNPSKQYSPGL